MSEPGNDASVRVSVSGPWNLYAEHKRRAFLWVLFLIGTSNYIDRNIIGILLEPIKAEFGVSDTTLGVLSGLSFALFYATLGIPIARFADRSDRIRVITASLAVWSVMTVLCGVAGTFWQLATARFGVGAGEAGAVPAAQSLIADYYPPRERARALAIFTASSSAGYVGGLVAGGAIAQRFGWRAAFLCVGVFGMVLAPLAGWVLQEPRRVQGLGLRTAASESLVGSSRALLSNPAYMKILAATVLYFFMAYGALVFLVPLVIRAHGLPVARAGLLVGALSAMASVVGGVGGGMLADRLAARDSTRFAQFAGWMLIAAIPLYEAALGSRGLFGLVALLMPATIVLFAAVPAIFAAVHLVCGEVRRAYAVAVVFLFANLLGLGLGPVITGLLSDRLGGVYGPAAGLRYALMLTIPVLAPAGWFMLRAARCMGRDGANEPVPST